MDITAKQGELFVISAGMAADGSTFIHGPYVARRDLHAKPLMEAFANWVEERGVAALDRLPVSVPTSAHGFDDSRDPQATRFISWLEQTGLVHMLACKTMTAFSSNENELVLLSDEGETVVANPAAPALATSLAT